MPRRLNNAPPKRNRRVTIKTVAAHAGVSTTAVSKVLRNAYGVSADMEARVKASIAALKYRPHAAARGMRGRTYTIGIVLSDIRNPFFPDLIDSTTSVLNAAGFETLLAAAKTDIQAELRLIEALMDRQMDGIVLVGPRFRSEDLRAIAKAIPIVVIGRHEVGEDFDTVTNDDLLGAHLAIEHLVKLGHRSIAHLTVPPDQAPMPVDVSPYAWRLQGYREAMTSAGLGDEIRVVYGTAGHQRAGYAAARAMLSAADRPTGVFGWVDSYAIDIMAAARDLGISVPDELSVVGYDNSSLSSLSLISLTSVDQNSNELGQEAARLLLERIDGRVEAVQRQMVPEVRVRSSTARPAAPAKADEKPAVTQALGR